MDINFLTFPVKDRKEDVMKITAKKFTIFLGLLLLVFVAGSEAVGQVVDRGRHYCPIHDEIYVIAGEHGGSQCSSTRTAPPVEEAALLYCTRCNTRYPEEIRHICPKLPPVVASRPNTQNFVGVGTSQEQRIQQQSFWDKAGDWIGGILVVDVDARQVNHQPAYDRFGIHARDRYGEDFVFHKKTGLPVSKRVYRNLNGVNFLKEKDREQYRDERDALRSFNRSNRTKSFNSFWLQ